MDAVVGRAMAPWRFASWVLALFAALALLLAIVGLVSVISLDVAHRRREFAIRLALGARSGEVSGAGAARHAGARRPWARRWAWSRRRRSAGRWSALLFGVPPLHWPTYGTVLLVVVPAALVAAWVPVRWAARIDPIAILRTE